MIDEKKEEKVSKSRPYKVLRPFVLDKEYRKGSIVILSDKKIIDKLISNNFIK